MKKKIKLFATIATLCLSLAMFTFGVFSALTVTYKTTGTISYDIEDTYVEIETRIYSTSKKYDDEVTLKTKSQEFETSTFTTLDTLTTTGLVEGETTHDFNKVQIKNLDQGEDYTIQESDYKDTYSSVTATEAPEDLEVALKYQTTQGEDKGVYTYFVVTKLTNKSALPLYVSVPTEGEDKYVAPENSHAYKFESYKEISDLNSQIYIVFAMSLNDITVAIDASSFVYPITVSKNLDSATENSPEVFPTFSTETQNVLIGGKDTVLPTTQETAIDIPLSSFNIDMASATAISYMDFNMPSTQKSLYKASLYNSALEYISLSFTISFYCPQMDITEEMSLYEVFGSEMGEDTTVEDYIEAVIPLIGASFQVFDNSSDSNIKNEIKTEDGLKIDITVDTEKNEDIFTISIPKSLLTNNSFCLKLYGEENVADLGLMMAIMGYYGGTATFTNFYTNANLTTKLVESFSYTGDIFVDGNLSYMFIPFEFKNLPQNKEAIFLTVSSGAQFFLFCVSGTYTDYTEATNEAEYYTYTMTGTTLKLPIKELSHPNYTLIIIYSSELDVETMGVNIICDYGVLTLYEYTLDEDCYYISRLEATKVPDNGVLELPTEYNGLPVKKIGMLFTDIQVCKNVTELIIPSSYTYIGEFCFSEWPNLQKVSIHEGNGIRIDIGAFNNCLNLKEVNFPSSKVEASSQCFYNTGVEHINLKNGYFATFSNCKNLKTITIGENVTGFSSSGDCPNVTSIIVDEKNTTFDSRDNCNAIIETATNTLILGCQNTVVPNDIAKFSERAFAGSNIESITIPSNVTSLQSTTFENCYNLNEIVVELGNTVYDSRNNCNAIINTSTNELIVGSNKTVIPEDVVSISYSAFTGRNIESLVIPKSVTKISGGFYNCPKLTELVVDSENTIYDSRNNCNAIIETSSNNLIIGCVGTIVPDGVRSIYGGAFRGVEITTVILPDSVVSIDNSAFYSCKKLEKIRFGTGITWYAGSVVQDCTSLKEYIFDCLYINNFEEHMIECVYNSLVKGGVVKVKCSSLLEITLEYLKNSNIFSASYDSVTGYAIFTKI